VVASAFEPLGLNASCIEETTRERWKLKLATVVIEKEEGVQASRSTSIVGPEPCPSSD
jgi:hypothetical protein